MAVKFFNRGVPDILNLRLLVIALMFSGVAGCERSSEHAQEPVADHARLAEFYLEQGSLRPAVLEAKRALQKSPDDNAARWTLVKIFLRAGDGGAAAQEIARLVGESENQLERSLALAKAHLLQGEANIALEVLDSAAREESEESEEWQLMKAQSLLASGQTEQADKAFQNLIDSESSVAAAMVGKAKIALAAGNAKEGSSRIAKAISLDKSNLEAWQWKARIAALKENWTEAENAYATVRDLEGTDILTGIKIEAIQGVVKAKIAQGKFEEAFKYNEGFMDLYPDSVFAEYERGVSMLKSGEVEAGREKLQRIVEKTGPTNSAALMLGLSHYGSGNYRDAERYIGQYLEATGSTDVKVSEIYAATQLQLRNYDKAVEVLESLAIENEESYLIIAMLGSAYLNTGKIDQGISRLRQALTLWPDQPAVRTELGRALLSRGDVREAISEFDSVLAEESKNSQANYLKLAALLIDGKDQEASRLVREWGSLNPADEKEGYRRLYGMILLASVGAKKSTWGVQQVTELAPPDSATHGFAQWALAEFYLRSGQGALAEAAAVSARQHLDKKYSTSLRLLEGKSLLVQKDWDGAVELLSEELGDQAGAAEANFYLALAHSRRGDLNSSIAAAEKAIQMDNTLMPAMILLSELYAQKKDFVSAGRYASQLKELRPNLSSAAILQGDLYAKEGLFGRAANAYEEALDINWSYATLARLVSALNRAGEHERAIETINRSLKTFGDAPAVRALLGNQHLAAEDYEKAAEAYEQANTENGSSDPVVLNNLAWVYAQLNDQRAEETGRKALALAPQNWAIMDTLGWVLVEKGKYDEGLGLLRAALEEQPGNQMVRRHLADGLEKAGIPENDPRFRQ